MHILLRVVAVLVLVDPLPSSPSTRPQQVVNAGVYKTQWREQDYRACIATNFEGAVETALALAPHLSPGALVLMVSSGGWLGGWVVGWLGGRLLLVNNAHQAGTTVVWDMLAHLKGRSEWFIVGVDASRSPVNNLHAALITACHPQPFTHPPHTQAEVVSPRSPFSPPQAWASCPT